MTLLKRSPTTTDLARLYHELAQHGAPSVGRCDEWEYEPDTHEALIVLACEMLRYDPRLLSILVQHTYENWRGLNPRALRVEAQQMNQPQVLLVVAEFVREATEHAELRYMIDYLDAGYRPLAPAERFFFGVESPGSRIAARRKGRSLIAYTRWGFVGSERPSLSNVSKRLVGRYDGETRGRIRRTLAKRRGQFRLAEYLEELRHTISRQQAYADLAGDPNFGVEGHGRGARWVMNLKD